MTSEHPTMLASQSSWRCVQAKDKAGWLALMADDICIEDPIGVALTNPDGKGIRGKAAVAEFFDRQIAPMTIRIETHESHVSEANEAAHLMTLTMTLPNGVVSRVRGIFTYRTNDEGKLTNLRGFWNMAAMQFEQPE